MTGAEVPVIAIDGPSGAGKGTIARRIADWLGWHYLDSGALYRVLAFAAQERAVPLTDEAALAKLASRLNIRFEHRGEDVRIVLDGSDVTEKLRTERAGEAASQVAQFVAVRAALLELQRGFAEAPGLVADGRDMGTVVFPRSRFKLFLTASPLERARRRHKQLIDKGINVSLPALAREITERDARDRDRAISPARPAGDATVLDSTGIGIEAVVDQVKIWLTSRGIEPKRI